MTVEPIANLLAKAEQETTEEHGLAASEPIAFRDYLGLVAANPQVAALAHARLYDMIRVGGITQGDDKEKAPHYRFFDGELYGLDHVFRQLVEEYIAPAARRLDIRKRILMFVGPVGGGKSTIATLLKRGLERYSRDHAAYYIDGCPMFEEPLHLIPESQREGFQERLGVVIEGDLCPQCQHRLEHEWGGRIGDVRVRRLLFSEKRRVGIGSYKASDPKSADPGELIGHVNLSALVDPRFGGETDPNCYRFDGELNVASRGMVEFIEMLKADARLLYELNTVAGEQRIKPPGFSLVYVDTVVLSHTNSHEFHRYFGDPANEAMVDRIFVIRVPYNLRLSDEVRIYQKLIGQARVACPVSAVEGSAGASLGHVHIAPRTLRVASMLAVLSRLKPSDKQALTPMVKLKLYDGEQRVGEWEQRHLREIRDEAEKTSEGMDGLGPRFVINRLSSALSKGTACINPLDALRSMRDGIKQAYANDPNEQDRLLGLLEDVRKDYDDWAKKSVQRAFVHAYEESTKALLARYLENVDAYCQKTKLKDPVSGEDVEPDERMMQGIEEQIGLVGEARRREFREGIMRSVAAMAMRGQGFVLGSRSDLQEALEKKLFADLQDSVRVTTSVVTPDKEQSRKIDEVIATLTHEGLAEDERYCEVCARELLKYVGTLLNRS